MVSEERVSSARSSAAVGATLMPRRSSSVAIASTRSVSCLRVWAMPRILTGPSASVATVARVRNVSEKALKSKSPPRIEDQDSAISVPFAGLSVAPQAAATLAKAVSP